METEKSGYCEKNRVIIRIWTSADNTQYPGNNVGHISLETQSPNAYISLWPVPWTLTQIEEYRRLQTKIRDLQQQLQHQQAKALQTKVEKMSTELELKMLKYFGERDAMYHPCYEKDEVRERDPQSSQQEAHPQLTICLYSLNSQNIVDKFAELQQKITTWRLMGSNLLVQKAEALTQNLILNTKEIESTVGKKKVDSCASIAYKLLKEGGIYRLVSSSYSSAHSSVVKPDELANMLITAKRNELKKFPETAKFVFADETPMDQLTSSQSCRLM